MFKRKFDQAAMPENRVFRVEDAVLRQKFADLMAAFDKRNVVAEALSGKDPSTLTRVDKALRELTGWTAPAMVETRQGVYTGMGGPQLFSKKNDIYLVMPGPGYFRASEDSFIRGQENGGVAALVQTWQPPAGLTEVDSRALHWNLSALPHGYPVIAAPRRTFL